MFVSITVVSAICVALAISGWDSRDVYEEDPSQLLLSYDLPSFEWPNAISMDEIGEWFLFFDDQKLIDNQYFDSHQCDCYDTVGPYVDHVIHERGTQPSLHRPMTSFHDPRTQSFDLRRLKHLINEVETVFSPGRNVPSLPTAGPLVRLYSREKSRWQTCFLDGRLLLLLSILIQIAVWTYSHNFSDKTVREQNKCGHLTEERLEMFRRDIRETVIRSEAALMRKYRQDLQSIKMNGDMFFWTSRDGYSPNWYKICDTNSMPKDTTPVNGSQEGSYGSQEGRYLSKDN